MSDSTQAANVTAADDFEANRAKTKKALPALLIVFTLGTLMIQAFNLVFRILAIRWACPPARL